VRAEVLVEPQRTPALQGAIMTTPRRTEPDKIKPIEQERWQDDGGDVLPRSHDPAPAEPHAAPPKGPPGDRKPDVEHRR
jgi:hypothetical protein